MSFRLSKKSLLSVLVVVIAFVGIAFGFRAMLCSPVYAFCGQEPLPASSQLAPNYFVFSPATLKAAESKSNEKIVLYFWAPWCSTCTSVDDDIRSGHQKVPTDVMILRVDYDHEQQLRQQYNVTIQHTFIQVNSHGQPIATWVGGDITSLQQHLL